jgi:uroporphyrin-III C-methyltransferase/precorrin-2 dehydrogenase/sirohydrochlorin ferrochelatase
VPVNIVDAPDISTFSFGSIVNRSPVVIGISTAGVAPVLGQAIRAKVEALLNPALAAWAAAAARLRATIKARFAMGPARRDAWRRFADRALAARSAPTSADLSAAERIASVAGGTVALVGAGPGETLSCTTASSARRSSSWPAARPGACWSARPPTARAAGTTTSTRSW